MSDHPKVAIFWDYENCCPPSNSSGLGYDIVNNISRIARLFGSVTTFRAYLDIAAQSSKSVALRSELQSSGLSMIDCPHNGKKDVVDKMILVDMLAFALDHPTPATIILITGDRDYAYAVSTLRLRKYQVVLVVPSSPHAPPSLESQASLVIDWGAAVLRTRTEPLNSIQAVRQPYPDLDANLVTKLERELRDPHEDLDSAATPQITQRLRRISARDLLEPSKHCKNVGCSDSTQELTSASTSPKKSTSTAIDPAPGGLSIPKTPSHSRRASISTGSTRTRSTTIVAQSPSAMAQDISVKNLPTSGARQSGASDITAVAGPGEHYLAALPQLDTLELPVHDSRPPSSIVIRSPLESSQSTSVPGKQIDPFHKFDCLASPFVLNKAKTDSIPGSCTEQSHGSIYPFGTLAEPFRKIATSVRETPQIKDFGAPKEIEHLTRIGNDDLNTRRSTPSPIRSKERTCDAADTPKSNYNTCVAAYATYSPPSGNVGLRLTDLPLGKHVWRARAATPGIVDDTNSKPTAPPDHSAAGSMPVPYSNTIPSPPFTTPGLHENEQHETWSMFRPLIHLLLAARERGITRPTRSMIALDLVQSDHQVYKRVGVSRFRDYATLAEQAGIIELGGRDGGAWIALHSNWFGASNATTIHVLSNGDTSPESLNAQDPLISILKTPPIERTIHVTPPTPTFTLPNFDSPENRILVQTLPTDRRDGDSWVCIPTQFQPLIDILVRMRDDGLHQVLRSVVGQTLNKGVYAQAGVSGFKEYVHQASEAQLVQFGGVGGLAWICLHPDLRI